MDSRSKHLSTIFLLVLALISCMWCSCSNPKTIAGEIDNHAFVENANVESMELERSTFYEEIISTGKLSALQKVELHFKVPGQLRRIFVRNGQSVRKGQLLAELVSNEYQQTVERHLAELKKATYELEDQLLGRGYDLSDSAAIPKDIYEMAAIRSGYYEAFYNHQKAIDELTNTRLLAPFAGRVADIQLSDFSYIKENDQLGSLINDSSFAVEFYLMESELVLVALKDVVKVIPFVSAPELVGQVISINPTIDENGMCLIQCEVRNNGKLVDGMNVTVHLQIPSYNQMVVPKTAVVLRDEQPVIFKVRNKKAYWVYVETLAENSSQYTIRAHPTKAIGELTVGDTIIIAGNENLAHDNNIAIIKHHKLPSPD